MKQVGVTCDVVADGDEVLPKARDVRYDASLLDIVVERLEGVDSCRRVRESGVEAAMIAVTANGDAHHRRKMGRAELSVLVTKTYDRGDVERALKVGVGGCRGHCRWWGVSGGVVFRLDGCVVSGAHHDEFGQHPAMTECVCTCMCV